MVVKILKWNNPSYAHSDFSGIEKYEMEETSAFMFGVHHWITW